ncbi:O-phosphoseryl-tRNA(Sec) selenium transferase [Halotydeus destructor]|nr:O-phosphoseryl-tRNA(Sec) selenium transferase [Halotydeus destructor]
MEPDIPIQSKDIKKTYIDQANQAIRSRESVIHELIEKGKCPETGWDDALIEMFIQKLSLMDSNNFVHNVGLGEREARIACDIVARRHFRLGHGIGRSGDLTEAQPKAAGSSLLNTICNRVALDILKQCGVQNCSACFVSPMATGMSLTLCLLSFRQIRTGAKYVIWPRIDQKSCFKCILTAGFEPIVIENRRVGDALTTDLDAIESAIDRVGSENILCILSTTSCFAPRLPDNLKGIGIICRNKGIPHIVNNAYGVQSSKCMHLIEEASRQGRIDVFVQSTDKNFMVPVGGSIIAGFDPKLVSHISSSYPGRASVTPSLDLLITLLHIGSHKYKLLLKERKVNFDYLKSRLNEVSSKFGEKVLETKDNSISLAMTINSLKPQDLETKLGSMLFIRGISGTRVVVSKGDVKNIGGHNFTNWCSHSNDYGHSYLTAAAAVGVTREEIDVFVGKLEKLLNELLGK